jgi:signal transduction histidine kinase
MEMRESAEVRVLKACINDLIGIVALPAIWSGGEPSQIAGTLLDVLVGMLRLELVYIQLNDPIGEAPIELARVAESPPHSPGPREIADMLERSLGSDPKTWPPTAHLSFGNGDISLAILPLGLHGADGVIVAGAERGSFPEQTERLLLSVAANQTVMGVQEARLMRGQKRLADDLDRRISHRTSELATANEELRKEIAERRLVEGRLRREEAGLKRSKALLSEAQRLSSTGSWYWLVAENTLEFSDQTCAIYDIDPRESVTLELIASRIHPEDIPILQEMIAIARGPATDLDYLYRAQLPDKSVKYLHLVATGTRDKEGRLEYIGAIQDITQRHLSEVALARVRSDLTHVARVTSLGALTASIAHEVNQPLSGIVTNANTCLRMLAADPPNLDGAKETARRTIRDGNRAAEVITRLRALFTKQSATTEPVDLNEAAREVIALTWSELQRSHVVLRSELAEDLPPVTGDRVQLQQVILNLLLNAVDAMSGVEDRPRQLLIRTERDEDAWVRLTTKDVGVGFEPRDMDRLFDAFYTTKSGGMGIGLSVSHSIIESHHGRLSAARNDGPGASFSFSLPCAPARTPEGKRGAHVGSAQRTS